MPGSGFFRYSRKERLGIYALLMLISVIFVLPDLLIRLRQPDPSAAVLKEQQVIWQEVVKAEAVFQPAGIAAEQEKRAGSRSFPFDPNTIDSAGLLELGLRSRTIATLLNYRRKGGRFRKPEDLYRLYGLAKKDADRLLPFVQLKASNEKPDSPSRKPSDYKTLRFSKAPPATLDINQADSLAWLALPGIGPALTHRILLFRERLGGFYRLEQLGEVYGLADSVFQQVQPRLRLDAVALRKIRINSAGAAELSRHPYIRSNLAREIEAFRKAHGSFTEPKDLLRLRNMDEALLNRLEAYLDFGRSP